MADLDSVDIRPHSGSNGHDEASARRRVVVVNDAPAVLALYRDMLEELNFEPVMMATEAIETERIRQAKPDAVLLDLTVGLQAEYGVEMAKELRADERYAAIPIVVATANADALDGSRQALDEIGVPILLKPFTVEELGTSLAADQGAAVNPT
jgi:two-component system, OmpR family, phosphate regulon response regulator PhoB